MLGALLVEGSSVCVGCVGLGLLQRPSKLWRVGGGVGHMVHTLDSSLSLSLCLCLCPSLPCAQEKPNSGLWFRDIQGLDSQRLIFRRRMAGLLL